MRSIINYILGMIVYGYIFFLADIMLTRKYKQILETIDDKINAIPVYPLQLILKALLLPLLAPVFVFMIIATPIPDSVLESLDIQVQSGDEESSTDVADATFVSLDD